MSLHPAPSPLRSSSSLTKTIATASSMIALSPILLDTRHPTQEINLHKHSSNHFSPSLNNFPVTMHGWISWAQIPQFDRKAGILRNATIWLSPVAFLNVSLQPRSQNGSLYVIASLSKYFTRQRQYFDKNLNDLLLKNSFLHIGMSFCLTKTSTLSTVSFWPISLLRGLALSKESQNQLARWVYWCPLQLPASSLCDMPPCYLPKLSSCPLNCHWLRTIFSSCQLSSEAGKR